jgi:hypothetical protein
VDLEVKNQGNNYLFSSSESDYFTGLRDALGYLESHLANKQKRSLFKDLQIEGSDFDEAKYLQAACETSIAAYFAKTYGDTFVYEPKVNPPKDVDCGFELNGKTYNIEVKCPYFSKKNEIDSSNSFKIGAFGRLIDFEDVVSNLKGVFDPESNPAADPDKPLITQQHMDNKLKDYLVSAHGKFKESTGPNELNVLAVCCADWTDMQKWFFYMYGHQGLFTSESFYPFEEYKNVDVVILTNLYHRHHEYQSKDKIKGHWDFSKSFNLIFSNPLRRENKKEIIWNFVDAVPNHSKQLMNYEVKNGLDEMRIPHYVCEELLGKGLYYFQPNS